MKLTVENIQYMVSQCVKNVLKENYANEMQAYHGTTADFDKFDHSFMGTGESTQAYGWGTYVSDCYGTGEYYAMRIANKRLDLKAEKKTNDELRMNGVIGRVMKSVGNAIRTGKVPFEDGKQQFIASLEGKISPEYIEQYRNAKTYDEIESISVNQRKKALKPYDKIIYHLDIPDNNGSNYIDWFSTDENLMREIYAKYEEQFHNGVQPKLGDTFGHFYQSLCKKGLTDKDVSLFLNGLGYVGFYYPIGGRHVNADGTRGDGRGMNYTIFNEKDLKIIKKEHV